MIFELKEKAQFSKNK